MSNTEEFQKEETVVESTDEIQPAEESADPKAVRMFNLENYITPII